MIVEKWSSGKGEDGERSGYKREEKLVVRLLLEKEKAERHLVVFFFVVIAAKKKIPRDFNSQKCYRR